MGHSINETVSSTWHTSPHNDDGGAVPIIHADIIQIWHAYFCAAAMDMRK